MKTITFNYLNNSQFLFLFEYFFPLPHFGLPPQYVWNEADHQNCRQEEHLKICVPVCYVQGIERERQHANEADGVKRNRSRSTWERDRAFLLHHIKNSQKITGTVADTIVQNVIHFCTIQAVLYYMLFILHFVSLNFTAAKSRRRKLVYNFL